MTAMAVSPADESADEALMLAWQQGSEAAFAQLYQRYRQPLYSYLLRAIGRKATAEEVYQEVWLTLVRQRQKWQAKASFRTYLFCLAHSRLHDYYRRSGRLAANEELHDEMPDIAACATGEPLPQLEEARLQARLRHCLQALPEEQRAVLVLKLESELPLQSIAEQLGVAFETLKSRFRYAQKKVQACLGGGA